MCLFMPACSYNQDSLQSTAKVAAQPSVDELETLTIKMVIKN